MRLPELEGLLSELFGAELLARAAGEWGITVRGKDEIGRIAFAVNLTPETAKAAVDGEADLLVTHHDAWPFLYGMPEACRSILAEKGVSHLFVHAPLDAADFGTAARLAQRLGLTVTGKSNLQNELYYAGRVGVYEPPRSFAELAEKFAAVLGEPVKAWQNNDRPVRRVGVTTGGGMMTNELKEVVDKGCDTYITGEKVLYTVQYAKFAGLNLLVGSHTYTEIFGVEGLAAKLKESFPRLATFRLAEPHDEQ